MAINFASPTTTDNYSTAFTQNIQANQTGLAQWLDSTQTTITGTPPTYAKRYNRASSAVEEYSGAAWGVIQFHGLTYLAGAIGIGGTPAGKFDVVGSGGTISMNAAGDTIGFGYNGLNYLSAAGAAATLQMQAMGAAGKLLFATNAAERMRIDSAGLVGIGVTPAIKLHVKGSSEMFRLETTTARASGALFMGFYDPTGVKGRMGFTGATDDCLLFNDLAGYLSFGTSATERLRITSVGVIQDAAGNELGYRRLPLSAVVSGAFGATDSGKRIEATAGVTVPNSTMIGGDVVTIFNATASAITITATVATLRQAGTTNTGSRSLAAYGEAVVAFLSPTLAFISGNIT